jgi:hypothetical protein
MNWTLSVVLLQTMRVCRRQLEIHLVLSNTKECRDCAENMIIKSTNQCFFSPFLPFFWKCHVTVALWMRWGCCKAYWRLQWYRFLLKNSVGNKECFWYLIDV